MSLLSEAKKVRESDHQLIDIHSSFLTERSKNDKSHKDGKLHPSSISCGCITSAVLDIILIDSVEHSAGLLRIFGLGHAIHDMLQKEFIAAGVIPIINGEPAVEVPLSMPEHNLVGHADGILEYGGSRKILEIKSINSMLFSKLEEPKEAHKVQAACYVFALQEELQGGRDVVFIYFSKNDSKMKEFVVTVTDSDLQDIKDTIGKIKRALVTWDMTHVIPAPQHKLSSPNCRYCSHKSTCHDTFYRKDLKQKIGEQYDVTDTSTPSKPRKIAPKGNGKRFKRSK